MITKPTCLGQHLEYILCDTIDEYEDHIDFIADLKQLTDRDKVRLCINSGGGRVDIGHMIIQAIRSSKAFIECHVVHASYSMASLIALACDNLVMYPNILLMFHNYSSGADGKGAELVQSITQSDAFLKGITLDTCAPFLTKEEIKNIMEDRDLYIKWNDRTLKSRIKRHFKSVVK